VVALFLSPDWFQFAAHGSEAPIAVAFMLWAIERHLDGRPAQALVLGTLACLLRPELVPFLGVYGLWVWRAEPRLRKLVAGAFVLLPVLWVGPEWIGSGMPLDGGAQARSEPGWSLSLADRPWLRALERVHNHAGLPLELLAALAIAVALIPRQVAVLTLAGAALAEVALFVAMTQAGFSGNPRYVLPAIALAAVLAGVGASRLAHAGSWLVEKSAHIDQNSTSRPRGPALTGLVAAVSVLFVVAHGFADRRVQRLDYEAHQVEERMQIHADVARAVQALGGAGAIKAIGWSTSNRALQTRLAWELGVPMEVTESLTDYRVIFRSAREPLVGRVYMTGRARHRQTLVRVGTVRVYRRDGITFPERRRERREWRLVGDPFTGPLQGFHTKVGNGRIARPRVVTR
jgi:hypothetical protein